MRNQTGKSLTEILFCLAIAAVLCTLAIPPLAQSIATSASKSAGEQLFNLLHFARSQAVLSRKNISICAGTESCDSRSTWQDQLLVFTDSNANGIPDGNDQIMRILNLGPEVRWSWRGFRSNSHLTFEPDGTTRAFNGTAALCHETATGMEVIVNLAGRIRSQRASSAPRCT